MFTRVVGVFALAAALGSAASAQIVVKPMTKNGDTINGEYRFHVTVDSKSLVSQVEFYVADKLVSTDDSTPYEYVLDTLTLPDGPVKVAIAAYNSDGQSQKVTLNLKVDNGLTLGVAHHVQIAEGFLVNGKWDAAIEAGRVALKISATDNSARMVMARAYFGKGVYDMAQKYAEDTVKSDPKNIPARDLLAGISLRQAFRAMATSGDREQTLQTVTSALKTASESRRAAYADRLDQFGPVTSANRLKYTDAVCEAGRFSLAIEELQKLFTADERNAEVADRLIYAQIRSGRYSDARDNITRHMRRGAPDAYGYALKAVLDDWFGDSSASADAEREALLNDPSNLGVRTAQAFLALRRGNLGTFTSIATSLAESEGSSPITSYYLTSMYYLQNNYDSSNSAFEAGLLADPSMYHIYIERFNQAISYYVAQKPSGDDKKYQLAFARAFAEGALEAKPESFEALTAIALVDMFEGKFDDAITIGKAAAAAGPEYAAAQYALAGAYFSNQMPQDGTKAMASAAKLDKYLDGIRAPKTEEAWRYFYRNGRTPLLVPPGKASGSGQ